jgi:hypothetical protein
LDAAVLWNPGHLWNSYNVLIPILSKTYARGGTSAPPIKGGSGPPKPVVALTRLNLPCPEPATIRRTIQAQPGVHSMMDILMLALAAGLFAAGIGYAYACERL